MNVDIKYLGKMLMMLSFSIAFVFGLSNINGFAIPIFLLGSIGFLTWIIGCIVQPNGEELA